MILLNKACRTPNSYSIAKRHKADKRNKMSLYYANSFLELVLAVIGYLLSHMINLFVIVG